MDQSPAAKILDAVQRDWILVSATPEPGARISSASLLRAHLPTQINATVRRLLVAARRFSVTFSDTGTKSRPLSAEKHPVFLVVQLAGAIGAPVNAKSTRIILSCLAYPNDWIIKQETELRWFPMETGYYDTLEATVHQLKDGVLAPVTFNPTTISHLELTFKRDFSGDDSPGPDTFLHHLPAILPRIFTELAPLQQQTSQQRAKRALPEPSSEASASGVVAVRKTAGKESSSASVAEQQSESAAAAAVVNKPEQDKENAKPKPKPNNSKSSEPSHAEIGKKKASAPKEDAKKSTTGTSSQSQPKKPSAHKETGQSQQPSQEKSGKDPSSKPKADPKRGKRDIEAASSSSRKSTDAKSDDKCSESGKPDDKRKASAKPDAQQRTPALKRSSSHVSQRNRPDGDSTRHGKRSRSPSPSRARASRVRSPRPSSSKCSSGTTPSGKSHPKQQDPRAAAKTPKVSDTPGGSRIPTRPSPVYAPALKKPRQEEPLPSGGTAAAEGGTDVVVRETPDPDPIEETIRAVASLQAHIDQDEEQQQQQEAPATAAAAKPDSPRPHTPVVQDSEEEDSSSSSDSGESSSSDSEDGQEEEKE